MRLRAVLLFQASQLVHGELAYRLWREGVSTAFELHRRQDEYAPEFGACGVGQTCAEACGNGFEKCDARDTSVLYCYNPGAGQACCPGGSGRACDVGFYCVNDPNGGQEYCCDEQSELSQCASDLGISTVVTPSTTSSTSSRTTSRSMTTTTSSSLSTITSTSTTTTPKSSLQIPSTSTATMTSSNSVNSTTTRLTTSSIFTAEAAPSASAIRAWGMGAAVVGWAVMI